MDFEQVNVECYSGYRANERPTSFNYRGRRWEVADIIDRWYEGGHAASRPAVNYYRVRTSGGRVFLLRYLSLFDAWSACPVEGAGRGGEQVS